MRLLHRLDRRVAVWPMDAIEAGQSAVVEIYPRIYIRNAGLPGKKIRTAAALDDALDALGSKAARLDHVPSDHETDALITAAGMRAHLAHPSAFAPAGLTADIARTEGWTFGVT
jgi:hypothetical protein